MRLAVIGCGYVGLVSGACFADFGHVVICVDRDEAKVAALKRGRSDFRARARRSRRSQRPESASFLQPGYRRGGEGAEVVFIAVGTPSRRGDGHADLSFVYSAAREIAAALDGFTVAVTKSTVPVGAGDEVERIIAESRPDADFVVDSNPEFLREGAAISDFKRPDRIVVGTTDDLACAVMQ